MATFSFSRADLNNLILSYDELAEIPTSVVDNMLTAGAAVLVKAYKSKIKKIFEQHSGKFLESVRFFSKLGSAKTGWKRYAVVYPYGDHGRYHRKKVVKYYKRSKHGRTYEVGGDEKIVTNNDIGFVLEFGSRTRNIRAQHWMRDANEECADKVTDAELAVYDDWLKSKNL